MVLVCACEREPCFGINCRHDVALHAIDESDDGVHFNDAFYSYNFFPWNYLQLPLKRASAYGRASFELTDATEAYAQVLYTDYSADLALAPTPSTVLRCARRSIFRATQFRGIRSYPEV